MLDTAVGSTPARIAEAVRRGLVGRGEVAKKPDTFSIPFDTAKFFVYYVPAAGNTRGHVTLREFRTIVVTSAG